MNRLLTFYIVSVSAFICSFSSLFLCAYTRLTSCIRQTDWWWFLFVSLSLLFVCVLGVWHLGTAWWDRAPLRPPHLSPRVELLTFRSIRNGLSSLVARRPAPKGLQAPRNTNYSSPGRPVNKVAGCPNHWTAYFLTVTKIDHSIGIHLTIIRLDWFRSSSNDRIRVQVTS